MIAVCEVCGAEFLARLSALPARNRFCSRPCRDLRRLVPKPDTVVFSRDFSRDDTTELTLPDRVLP